MYLSGGSLPPWGELKSFNGQLAMDYPLRKYLELLETIANSLCACAHLTNKVDSDSDSFFLYKLDILTVSQTV